MVQVVKVKRAQSAAGDKYQKGRQLPGAQTEGVDGWISLERWTAMFNGRETGMMIVRGTQPDGKAHEWVERRPTQFG